MDVACRIFRLPRFEDISAAIYQPAYEYHATNGTLSGRPTCQLLGVRMVLIPGRHQEYEDLRCGLQIVQIVIVEAASLTR